MHELAITQSMLNLALEYAKRAGAQRITHINLVIGEMSGVVDESVQFYFDFVSKDTLAEGAQLVFEWQPARIRCRACGHEFALEVGARLPRPYWACPVCQALGGEVVAGRELYMDSIEVE